MRSGLSLTYPYPHRSCEPKSFSDAEFRWRVIPSDPTNGKITDGRVLNMAELANPCQPHPKPC
eukprot:328937-Amphidinium_carterae.1